MTTPTFDMVLFLISQVFPDEWPDDIVHILSAYKSTDSYGAARTEPNRNSVYLACLLLSRGDKEALRRYAELADQDERDVWGPAHYPSYLETIATQYSAWKNGQYISAEALDLHSGPRVITLDADVARVFQSSETVNALLRTIIQAVDNNGSW